MTNGWTTSGCTWPHGSTTRLRPRTGLLISKSNPLTTEGLSDPEESSTFFAKALSSQKPVWRWTTCFLSTSPEFLSEVCQKTRYWCSCYCWSKGNCPPPFLCPVFHLLHHLSSLNSVPSTLALNPSFRAFILSSSAASSFFLRSSSCLFILNPVYSPASCSHLVCNVQCISPRRSSTLDRGEMRYRVWVVLVQQSTSKRVHLPRKWRRWRGRKRRRSRRRPESMCLNRDWQLHRSKTNARHTLILHRSHVLTHTTHMDTRWHFWMNSDRWRWKHTHTGFKMEFWECFKSRDMKHTHCIQKTLACIWKMSVCSHSNGCCSYCGKPESFWWHVSQRNPSYIILHGGWWERMHNVYTCIYNVMKTLYAAGSLRRHTGRPQPSTRMLCSKTKRVQFK